MNEESDESGQKPLMDALVYPIRGPGRLLLVIGAVLSAALSYASGFMIIGGVAWLLGLAYFNAFYFNIVESTVSGNDEAPDWPDVSDWAGEIILPMVRTIGVWLISFFPAMVVSALVKGDHPNVWTSPFLWAAMAWGALYFPMAILNVIVGNEMVAAMPHRVLPQIRKALPGYLALAGVLVLAVLASGFLSFSLGKLPLIGGLLSAWIGLYFAMAQARLAGRFYREHLEALETEEA